MRTLTLLWLLAWAMTPAVFAWAAGGTSPESWSGCYELRVAPDDAKKELWGTIPRRFELLASPWGQPPDSEQWLRVKSLDPGEHWLVSLWTPKNDDEMLIAIGNGFVGYSLKIKKSGTVLVGTAEPTSDDGRTYLSFPFKLAKVACKGKPSTKKPENGSY